MKAATPDADQARRDMQFQSTPPVKAATIRHWLQSKLQAISIHAAREGGDYSAQYLVDQMRISIHAAREGGDGVLYSMPSPLVYFNPRRP